MGEHTALSIQVYLLAIVISLFVAVMIRVVVAVLSVSEKKPELLTAKDRQAMAEGSGKSEVNDPAHAVAIAAAVAAAIGARRIVRITPSLRDGGWAAEGRLSHHASHNVARHSRR